VNCMGRSGIMCLLGLFLHCSYENNMLQTLVLWLLLVAAVSGAPQCNCNHYLRSGDKSSQTGCFLVPGGVQRTVRTLAQAQFACSSASTSCAVMTATRVADATVMTSAQDTMRVPELVHVQWRSDPQSDRSAQCPPRTTAYSRESMPLQLAWQAPSKCELAVCPDAASGINVPDALQPFVMGDDKRIMCNAAATPNNRCNAASRSCSCGSDWTGNACQWQKTTYCSIPRCSPSDARACMCGYPVDADDNGLALCQSRPPTNAPSCIACAPDSFDAAYVPGSFPAKTGSKCDQEACQPGCNTLRGSCQSICSGGGTHHGWCSFLPPTVARNISGYECRCEQSPQALYVGPTCNVIATNVDWHPGKVETSCTTGNGCCHTPGLAGDDAWGSLNRGSFNPNVCSGNGRCSVVQGTRPQCECNPGFLPTTRCFTRDPCMNPDRCSTNRTRATCTPVGGMSTDAICACRDPYYTARPTDICGANGCEEAGRPPWRQKADGQCQCPNGTVWARDVSRSVVPGQGRAGCRWQCPVTPALGIECGNIGYCSNVLAWIDGTKPWCDCTRIIGNARSVLVPATQTCELYCLHESFDDGKTCVCLKVRTNQGTEMANWKGPRCNETVCEHGGHWSGGQCVCVPPWGGRGDLTCRELRCDATKNIEWSAAVKACVCKPGFTGNPSAGCNLDCKNGGRRSAQGCDCSQTVFTGASCGIGPLCSPVDPADKSRCLCSGLRTGRFCNETTCDAAHTRTHNATACTCSDPLFPQPRCVGDLCSALFPDAGRAVRHRGATGWQCECADFVYLQPYVVSPSVLVHVCGCPAPRLLDTCPAQSTDARCRLATKDGKLSRCICPKGHEQYEGDVCRPFVCNVPGTVADADFVNNNGYWQCKCKAGWAGMRCENRTETPDCGHGTWNPQREQCNCDAGAVRDVAAACLPTGTCMLVCNNGGSYDCSDQSCVCAEPFDGPTCEERTALSSSSSSSTGLPSSSTAPQPVIISSSSSSSSSSGSPGPAEQQLQWEVEDVTQVSPYVAVAVAVALIVALSVTCRFLCLRSSMLAASSHEMEQLIQ